MKSEEKRRREPSSTSVRNDKGRLRHDELLVKFYRGQIFLLDAKYLIIEYHIHRSFHRIGGFLDVSTIPFVEESRGRQSSSRPRRQILPNKNINNNIKSNKYIQI